MTRCRAAFCGRVVISTGHHSALPYTHAVRIKVVGPQRASHSGLLEPRGSSTVQKAPGVLDRTTLSVKP
jgi:hypothetical protein